MIVAWSGCGRSWASTFGRYGRRAGRNLAAASAGCSRSATGRKREECIGTRCSMTTGSIENSSSRMSMAALTAACSPEMTCCCGEFKLPTSSDP